MNLKDIKYDCRHFRGGIPCKPNKDFAVDCLDCKYYDKIGKRILIIKLGAMGDVIRSTPLIVKYRELYPDCHITWLSLSPEVLPKDKIDEILKWNETSIFIIQNKKYDIAINLDKEDEACILLEKLEAKEKYGFIWNNEHIDAATPAAAHKLITGFFDHYSQKNTKNYLEEIFEICHLQFNNEEYLLNYNKELAEKWQKIIKDKSQGKTVVGLNTGVGNRWATRLLPEEHWISLINLLLENDFYPIILGGPQENEKNQNFANKTGAYYPGTFSLEEFFAISSNCEIILTQVSMMMHIATALKKKMVLMNNIFNKHEFYLYNRGVIIEPESGCDCYYGNKCKREISCMYDIKPETLLKEILKLQNS